MLRVASSPAELRAAAAVRSAAFAPAYPPDRSPSAVAAHHRVRVTAAWDALEAKLAGTDAQYAGVRVACLLALLPCGEEGGDDDARALRSGLLVDCATLPGGSSVGSGGSGPRSAPLLAVGTLDVNWGPHLPSEALGTATGAPARRAWLSNVATAPGARRRGLARALLRAAEGEARAGGAGHLFVHAVADNWAARALYSAAGFELDGEEEAAQARLAGREAAPRVLFHRPL